MEDDKNNQNIVGSAASGEGFVNVYRGAGRILIAMAVEKRIVSALKL